MSNGSNIAYHAPGAKVTFYYDHGTHWATSDAQGPIITAPGSFQSEQTIFSTYNAGGVRVYDIKDQYAPKEIASWLPPTPKKLIDPRPNVALAAKTADIYVTPEGLIYVSDWNAGLHVLEYQG